MDESRIATNASKRSIACGAVFTWFCNSLNDLLKFTVLIIQLSGSNNTKLICFLAGIITESSAWLIHC